MFISFEGIDGSGKSTQSRLLAEALRAEGHDVVLTREPGGSDGAEAIRRLLVEGGAERWSAETELLLFNAARRDHLERTIRPALARGAIVITDRFADSTRVYQGATRGDLKDKVEALHEMMIGIEPDRTFIVDVTLNIAAKRLLQRASSAFAEAAAASAAAAAAAEKVSDAAQQASLAAGHAAEAARYAELSEVELEDRFESMGAQFQRQLQDGFRELAHANSARVRIIDGSGTAEQVAARVRAAL
ncbi:dTMP kinase [Paracoccus sp. SCSIO 75233]|uniref:dTMP kinase n=1 Tax=Paracoccus sp. SCSIO 75233 TaxID=3017782 RepID=UPI0022F0C896|nr:dTMP kinase [Paracoccus sp. SCSIO 75233]WBU52379.1 dTMP kinase [Paracoccus sp. SCSIO 75233]